VDQIENFRISVSGKALAAGTYSIHRRLAFLPLTMVPQSLAGMLAVA
jgi:hypothetical protein